MLSGENKASLTKVRAEGKVEPPTLHMAVVWPILGMTTAQQVEAGGGPSSGKHGAIQAREGGVNSSHLCLYNPGPQSTTAHWVKAEVGPGKASGYIAETQLKAFQSNYDHL